MVTRLPKYCEHCEEKLVSREHCPYCSQWCKDMATGKMPGE